MTITLRSINFKTITSIISKSIAKYLRILYKKIIRPYNRYSRNYKEIDKELPYFVIISSIYENIGLPLLYIINIDKISQLFRNIYKIILKWRRLVTIGLNPIEALLYTALSTKSKKWRELIINYVTLQRLGGSATDFLNRKVEEALNDIKQTWKRYHDNIIFIMEVFLITIFSTVTMILLSMLLGSAVARINFVMILMLLIITISSIIIIDSIIPIDLRHYTPNKYTIFLFPIILAITYQILSHCDIFDRNMTVAAMLLFVISTLPFAIENFVHYTIRINKDNQSILNLLDYITTSQRYGIPLTKLKSSINNADTLTKRIKNLFINSLNDKNTDDYDYKERILVSLIIGLKYVGLIPYELLLKLRNIFSEIINMEKSSRKALNYITILTITLPPVLTIVLFVLVHSITKLYINEPYGSGIGNINLLPKNNVNNIYVDIYAYTTILSVTLNTIIGKAVDLSLRSFWRTHFSLLLLVISYCLVMSLLH